MNNSTITTSLLIAAFLLSALSGWTPSAAQSAATSPIAESPSFTTDEFRLRKSDGNFFLHFAQAGKESRVKIPTPWLIPAHAAKAEETAYVSSFNYDAHVTSFPIGNGMTGLHLSSFDLMTDGSAQAAAGRDVFLVYDPRSTRVAKGLIELGITKSRVREDGCFRATAAHFLLADVNRDRLVDIGMVQEAIQCASQASENGPILPVQPSYAQQPVQWFVFRENRWDATRNLRGHLPEHRTALPLIGLELSPVDYVADRYWQTHDATQWRKTPSPSALYQPPYRQALAPHTMQPPEVRP
jgi:hypothetical protein